MLLSVCVGVGVCACARVCTLHVHPLHPSISGPGVGSLLARFQLTEGPSKPAPLALQFTSEGSNLSGCDIKLVGPGYRFSLIKKRFAAGKVAKSRRVQIK